MESFGDKLRAFGLALSVHLLCILAMLVGLWWTTETRPISVPGPVIQVDLIGPTSAPKPSARAAVKPAPPKPEPPKPEPPQPEPPKPEPPKPEPPKPQQEETPPPTEVHQDQVERERIAALAEQKAEEEKKEQEEKRRQQQVLLEEKQRVEEERKKQLAQVRKEREAAEKVLKLEKEKLAQLQDRQRADQQKAERQRVQEVVEQESEQAQTGAGGQDNDLAARYAAAIQSAVTNNWNRPDSAAAGLRCSVIIVQIPGGDVISVTVSAPCNADQVTRNSIEQAVQKAAPLPYQGYEKVFQRSIKFNFKYDG
ncbi:MAG: TonB C-terminal domain-containing protein [Rhodanobacteraceae bacterium]